MRTILFFLTLCFGSAVYAENHGNTKVITVTPDTYGYSSAISYEPAFTEALRKCTEKSINKSTSGCGAVSVSGVDTWLLGITCDGRAAAFSGSTRDDAVYEARSWELNLTYTYDIFISSCKVVVEVSPSGDVTEPNAPIIGD